MSLHSNTTPAPHAAEVLAALYGVPVNDYQAFVLKLGLGPAVDYCEMHLPEDLFHKVFVAAIRICLDEHGADFPASVSYYKAVADALELAIDIDLGIEVYDVNS